MTYSHVARTRVTRRFAGAFASIIALSAALVGCANEDNSVQESASGAEGNFPVSVVSGDVESGEEITIEQEPSRIVSLSPSATEVLFDIGAGDQVVAVDEYSTYPDDAPLVEGLSGYMPNVESVLTHDPDLVVVSEDDEALASGLEATDVPMLIIPAVADIEGVYEQVERLGVATGNTEDAEAKVEEMQSDIEEAIASVPDAIKDAGLTYYHELDSSYYSITDATFIGDIYSQFGLSSIANESDTDYPQLSSEAIIDANPDLMFFANQDSEGLTLDQIAERPGWDTIDAVKNRAMIALNEDLASRWGTRTAEFIKLIAADLNQKADALVGANA